MRIPHIVIKILIILNPKLTNITINNQLNFISIAALKHLLLLIKYFIFLMYGYLMVIIKA